MDSVEKVLIPSWNSEPGSWEEYKTLVAWYVAGTKESDRRLLGARLAARLPGAAKLAVEQRGPQWLDREDGADRLVEYLEKVVG